MTLACGLGGHSQQRHVTQRYPVTRLVVTRQGRRVLVKASNNDQTSESQKEVKPFFDTTAVEQQKTQSKALVVDELVEELRDSKEMGKRGEVYFALQSLLILLVIFPPKGLGDLITTIGFIGLLGGVGFIASAALSLGDNLSPLPKPREGSELVTDGLYAVTRHPMYSGLILSALGLGICTNNSERILLALVLAFILDKKADKEETFLVEKYGSAYDDYTKSVKKLIPWLY